MAVPGAQCRVFVAHETIGGDEDENNRIRVELRYAASRLVAWWYRKGTRRSGGDVQWVGGAQDAEGGIPGANSGERQGGGSLAWVSGQVGPRGGGRCKISLAQRQLAARSFHIRLLAQAAAGRVAGSSIVTQNFLSLIFA